MAMRVHRTLDYEHLLPGDVRPATPGRSARLSAGSSGGQTLGSTFLPQQSAAWRGHARTAENGIDWVLPVDLQVREGKRNERGIDIDLVIDQPLPLRQAAGSKRCERRRSALAGMLQEQKFPEPIHYRNVDCMGIRDFLAPEECTGIIEFAESQGFRRQFRPRLLDVLNFDIVDLDFAETLWRLSGLGWLLRTATTSDGLVPCGFNEVMRVQKYAQGSLFGKHTDRSVQREDGRVSKYSLRIFLNSGRRDFEGGLSVFHVPFEADTVVFEPELGMALLYQQGELCTLQEETEVVFGCKYVLRADVLFCRPEDLAEHSTTHGV
eukprot:gb/GFBE01013492.1/.p1 GENE.gb/GFBE01013492.1/~~gb/GFBE01013492.1/.p1  ORF type:complete len:322 (+),score=64.70 gb/GFBE01013492.1/:1-966(+)